MPEGRESCSQGQNGPPQVFRRSASFNSRKSLARAETADGEVDQANEAPEKRSAKIPDSRGQCGAGTDQEEPRRTRRLLAGFRKPVKRVLGNRRAAENAGESVQAEATRDVATQTVCGRVGVGSNSTEARKSQENNQEAWHKAQPLEQGLRVRPTLRRL